MLETGVEPSIDRSLRQESVFERAPRDCLSCHGRRAEGTRAVPRLVQYLGRWLAAERRARGTRAGTRALTCLSQALLVLGWFRQGEDLTLLSAGFGVSRATAYRYRDEGIAVLAAPASD